MSKIDKSNNFFSIYQKLLFHSIIIYFILLLYYLYYIKNFVKGFTFIIDTDELSLRGGIKNIKGCQKSTSGVPVIVGNHTINQ